ncbi:DUF3310 domain-containing protein [Streptomyces sp. NPDC051445]|uniref:DUF3310 domain-containing protein n=1 Tax=Streptomyces sp. NPDC051445 TaxID=3365653 RepID=UPI0037B3A180
MKYAVGDEVEILTGTNKGYQGRIYSVNAHITAPFPYGVQIKRKGFVPRFLAYAEDEIMPANTTDVVNHPAHYKLASGVEVIDLTELLSFNRGNAVKYLSRAGLKNPATELEDLKKAAWYVQREISRVEKAQARG